MWRKKKKKSDRCYLEWKLDSTWAAANQIFTVKQKKETHCKEKTEGTWEREWACLKEEKEPKQKNTVHAKSLGDLLHDTWTPGEWDITLMLSPNSFHWLQQTFTSYHFTACHKITSCISHYFSPSFKQTLFSKPFWSFLAALPLCPYLLPYSHVSYNSL